jgi:hypothetical protein
VQELDTSFNVGQYDTEWGEKLVVVANIEANKLVAVEKITDNKQKLKAALWVSVCPGDAFPVGLCSVSCRRTSSGIGTASELQTVDMACMMCSAVVAAQGAAQASYSCPCLQLQPQLAST